MLILVFVCGNCILVSNNRCSLIFLLTSNIVNLYVFVCERFLLISLLLSVNSYILCTVDTECDKQQCWADAQSIHILWGDYEHILHIPLLYWLARQSTLQIFTMLFFFIYFPPVDQCIPLDAHMPPPTHSQPSSHPNMINVFICDDNLYASEHCAVFRPVSTLIYNSI